MSDVAAWVASAATMIAAMMTASNMGTRTTGWGFVVFTLGSIAWALVGLMTNQFSLALTNGFLLLVNMFGVWRWLGRQARHETGSAVAADHSRAQQHVPSLFSGASVIGAAVTDCSGGAAGTVIDTMHNCETRELSYVVVAQGGVSGAGETLRVISPANLSFDDDGVRCNLSGDEIAAIPPIDDAAWPAVAPDPLPSAPRAMAARA